MNTLTPQEAIQIVDQLIALAPVSRQQHFMGQQAVAKLQELIPSQDGAKPAEDIPAVPDEA